MVVDLPLAFRRERAVGSVGDVEGGVRRDAGGGACVTAAAALAAAEMTPIAAPAD